MPLQNTRVANEGSVISLKAREECKALVEALNKVVACYRHLAASVGGSSDSCKLRDELRLIREKAQELAVSNRNKLTGALKDKQLTKEDRKVLERLWVEFSSCLELLYTDMCKVFEVGQVAPLATAHQPVIQTGMTGPTAHIASRALSVQNIMYDDTELSKGSLELTELAAEIEKVDEMINDMEMKVNVLRWTVEASGDPEDEMFSNEASSLTLLSMEEGGIRRCCNQGQYIVSLLLCGAALVAVTLSVSLVNLA
ncbi:regulator of G-protein signaling 9-binding protein B-like [Ambystoma mexicanum]|uniref:regulator of G-protein signaling 9-binding protein B-like n=1 Tax=Ambystoma mexicanum TaxID=8296 RepID=UPI0037E85F72